MQDLVKSGVNGEPLNIEKKRSWSVLEVVVFGVAAMTLIPIIIASAYTFFAADDFSVVNETRIYGTNVIVAAVKFAINWYFTWQGTYTSAFLMIALSPLNGLGYIQLCAVMIFNIILFSLSLWAFVNAVCKSLNVDKIKYAGLFFSLCIIGIFGFTGWTEVFYWFVGATVYSFPMSFCLLGLAMALQSKSKKGICASGALMFLTGGGALEIAGMGCFVLLGICIMKWITKSVKIKDYIIFGFAVLGALINTVAPGNYVRHERIDDTGLHFGTAVIYTVLEVLRTIEELLFNTPCVLLILAAIAIGVSIGKVKKIQNKKMLRVLIWFCAITPFVTCFPVFLGYSRDHFPNRCKLIETIVIICAFMIIAAVIGYIMSEKIESLRKGEIYVGIVLFMVTMFSINPAWRVSQSVPGQMWQEIGHGSYKKYYESIKEIYNIVENDTNENVFIYNIPENVPFFPVIDLDEDMSYWINDACADYFGKASVQCVFEPLKVQSDGQKNIRISQTTFGEQTGYLSIYKLNEEGQVAEIIQELKLLDSNILISIPPEETGKMKVYFYEDPEGSVQVDEMEIEY